MGFDSGFSRAIGYLELHLQYLLSLMLSDQDQALVGIETVFGGVLPRTWSSQSLCGERRHAREESAGSSI